MTTKEIMQAPIRLSPLEKNHQLQCAKCGKRRKAFPTCAYDFTQKTSIHGVKYLGEGDRPIWEKIFWILVFVLSIYYCITMVLNVWHKWIESPLLVTFNERSTQIDNIPFPAVTICPEIKSNSEAFRFEKVLANYKKYQNLTEEEKKYIAALGQVCDLILDENDFPVNIDPIKILKRLALDPIDECKWKNVNVQCEDIFKKIVTDDGICYNFNGLDAEDIYREDSLPEPVGKYKRNKSKWDRNSGYKRDSGINTFPRRATSGNNGLEVTFVMDEDEKDEACKMASSGYRVSLHPPDNIPQLSNEYFVLPWGRHLIASVNPTMMITPLTLKTYSPETRKCFFSDERYLRHFKLYSQNNCNLECQTNFTLANCGCVHLSMPRVNTTPVCNIRQLECYNNATNDLLLEEFGRSVLGDENDLGPGCNCMPSCTHIEYIPETFHTKYSVEKVISTYISKVGKTDMSFNVSYAKLKIFFKENEFLASKRAELYGIADLLSNCGGLLGLFMGISALSFIEIFYFSTIRIFSDNWLRKKRVSFLKCECHQEIINLKKL